MDWMRHGPSLEPILGSRSWHQSWAAWEVDLEHTEHYRKAPSYRDPQCCYVMESMFQIFITFVGVLHIPGRFTVTAIHLVIKCSLQAYPLEIHKGKFKKYMLQMNMY